MSINYAAASLLYADLDDAQIDVVKAVRTVPHFLFYKNNKKITDVSGSDLIKVERTIQNNI